MIYVDVMYLEKDYDIWYWMVVYISNFCLVLVEYLCDGIKFDKLVYLLKEEWEEYECKDYIFNYIL